MSLVCAAVVSDPCPRGPFQVVVGPCLNSNITSFMLRKADAGGHPVAGAIVTGLLLLRRVLPPVAAVVLVG